MGGVSTTTPPAAAASTPAPEVIEKEVHSWKNPKARRVFMFGLTHDGFKVWDRKAIAWDEVDGHKEISPEMRALIKEFHDDYYTYGVDLPEFVALILLALYFLFTGGPAALAKAVMSLGGVPATVLQIIWTLV